MAISARLRGVKRQVEALRSYFLPVFDPLGNYQHRKLMQAHTRAFLVLSHAEIESYFEEWAKDIASRAQNIWLASNRVSSPLVHLLATVGERIKSAAISPKDAPARLNDEYVALFQRYFKQIKDNHGVKEVNVLGLLSPLGIPETAFGSTLLINLDTFGEDRGRHAHHSAKAVINVLDPETEYNRINALLVELESVDQWLMECRRKLQ